MQKTIPVGASPKYVVTSRDGRQLYVANNGGRNISVIDTHTEKVIASIKVGNTPHSLLLSHDGRRLYALVDDDPNEGSGGKAGLEIIDTSKRYVRLIPFPFPPGRTEAMALTPDDSRLYITRVDPCVDSPSGVYYLDTVTEFLQKTTSDLGETPCPVGIAISKDGNRLFVNYQNGGPGGSIAHDAIAEYELPSGKRIRVTNPDIPNVGDQLAISPDGAELWANGADACSRPDYSHVGCPSVPSKIINVLRVSDNPNLDLGLLKTIDFSLVDFNGRISLSPQGEAFVGYGINLKRVDPHTLQVVQRLEIGDAGEVAFSPDGKTAYVTVGDKNEVVVLTRGKPANRVVQSEVAALTTHNVTEILLKKNCPYDDPKKCAVIPTVACDPNDRECNWKSPTMVQASFIDDALVTRGMEDHPGTPPLNMQPGENSACFLSEQIKLESTQQIEQMLGYNSRKDNDEFLRFNGGVSVAKDAGQPFYDVTNQSTISGFQKTLGKHTAYLTVIVCPNRIATVLIPHTGKAVWEVAMDDSGKPVTRDALQKLVAKFRTDLEDPCSHPEKRAQALYNIIIPPKVHAALEEARQKAEKKQLTLVWELGDWLRYIPMSALSPDGIHYLIENFSNTVRTKASSLGSNGNGTFTALAAGYSNPKGAKDLSPLPNVPAEIGSLWAAAQTNNATISETILLDDGKLSGSLPFSTNNLQSELRKLEHPTDNQDHRMIVHIASHFVLGASEETSYLLTDSNNSTDSGKLFLSDISKETNGEKDFSFQDVWLVTFSACSTAAFTAASIPGTKASRIADGSEVQSLGYVADRNGAYSTVASLWDVTDISTGSLMEDFYAQVLQPSGQKAESLRHAQLSLLNGTNPITKGEYSKIAVSTKGPNPSVVCTTSFSHPKFWAPFILIGEGN